MIVAARSAFRLCLLTAALTIAAGCSGERKRPFDPAAECPAILADTTLPTRAEDAEKRREAGHIWSDRQARVVYVCRVRAIADADGGWRLRGMTAEARARRAYQIRHAARLTGRAMMSSRSEVAALEARDAVTYGHRDGPSWQWLVENAREDGLEGDRLYESIIVGASRTNDEVNSHFGL